MRHPNLQELRVLENGDLKIYLGAPNHEDDPASTFIFGIRL